MLSHSGVCLQLFQNFFFLGINTHSVDIYCMSLVLDDVYL